MGVSVRTRAILARQLALDAATSELVEAFRAHGVSTVLLKGPAIARTLYADPADRPYGDIDLLVEPGGDDGAAAVLRELGFASLRPDGPFEASTKADVWRREGPEPVFVDLHRTIQWPRADRDAVWRTLAAEADTLEVGGTEVAIPAPDVRGLLLALHACQHGATAPKPLTDLTRGLDVLSRETWVRARDAAARLGCTDAFARGLRLEPTGEGTAVAERLGLSTDARVEVHLRARGAPHTSFGFARLVARGTLGDRLDFLRRKLLPTPRFMRLWQPVAARGPAGLLLAYAWRPFWLAWHAPAGLRAVHAARSAAGRPRTRDLVRPEALVAAWWSWRAAGGVRKQLRGGRLDDVVVPPPPAPAHAARRGVGGALRLRRATCLESALVRQAWLNARGIRRDVVIGVTPPSEGFGAHAWLEGESPAGGFGELTRMPAR